MSRLGIIRTGLMAATSGLALLAAGATQAQTSSPVVPPENFTLDARGVDLVSGQFVYSAADVSIGQGAGQLARIRGISTFGAGTWMDSTQGRLVINGTTLFVAVGQQSEIFIQSGSVFTPQSNNGATLTRSGDIFTYTSANGTVARYSLALSFDGSGLPSTTTAVLYEVVAANGDTTNYHYLLQTYIRSRTPGPEPEPVLATASRLQSVTNNYGNQLHFSYESASIATGGGTIGQRLTSWLNNTAVTGVNNAVDYCAPLATACTFSRTWPRADYSRAPASGLETVTDQSGRVTTYQSLGNATTITLPGSSAPDVTVNYSATNLASVTDATGTWNYSFADSGPTRTTTVSGPLGQSLTVVLNLSIGRATSVTNALGQTTSYTYDAQRRVKRVTNPEGDYAELTYDGRGNVTTTTMVAKPGAGVADIVTSAAYPATCVNPVICNSPTSTTDARGNVTDYAWNASHGGLESMTAPAVGATRPQTRINYAAQTAYYKNSAGTIAAAPSSVVLPVSTSACATNAAPGCIGTADEVRTTLTYGAPGVANNLLPTASTSGDGTGALAATTSVAYTPDGDVSATDGSLPGSDDTTRYRYDSARRVIGVVGPDPDGAGGLQNRAQRTTYNSRGLVTLVEAGITPGYSDSDWSGFTTLQRQAATYDAQGRPLTSAVQDAAGNTLSLNQVSYDAAGRPECVATRMNPAAFTSMPGSACSLGTPGAYGPDRISQTVYDTISRPVSAISGVGTPSPITESIAYTANGKTLTLTDGKGNVSTLVYDAFDRPVRLLYPNASGGGASTTDYEEYAYDAGSNVINRRNRGGEVFTATYDALNRPLALSGGGITSRTFTYDLLNRSLNATDTTTGVSFSNTYDALGRVLSQGQAGIGTVSYGYDLAGRRTSMSWPDGFWAAYDYNLANEVIAIRENGAPNWNLAWFGYDNLGRRIAQGNANGSVTTWGYDGVSRLTSLTQDLAGSANDLTINLTYNPAGQIATRSLSNSTYAYTPGAGTTAYTNNGKNQVTNVGGTGIGYDGRQNITSIPGGSYAYNGLNQMASATVGGTATNFSYDPAGRLFEAGATRFAYDGQQVIGEYNTSGGLMRRYIPGVGLDNIVTAYEGSGYDRRWPMADERGSVVSVTDGSANALAINTYDEYGQPGSSNQGRFQYTGHMWLPQANLYHYRARTYAPQIGRFMQTDPAGYAAGANVYAYVGGDPVNTVDPSGLNGKHITEGYCYSRGGIPVSNSARAEGGSDHDFCVGGFTGGTGPRGGEGSGVASNGSGGSGGRPSEERQKENCKAEVFQRWIQNPEWQRRSQEAMRLALSTPSQNGNAIGAVGSEHGFYSGYMFGEFETFGSIFTNQRFDSAVASDPMFGIGRWNLATDRMLYHTHQNDNSVSRGSYRSNSLSRGDIGWARGMKTPIMAERPNGEKFCYAP